MMKLYQYGWIGLVACSCLLGVAIATLHQTHRVTDPAELSTADQTIPASLVACLPPAAQRSLKAKIQVSDTTYYTVGNHYQHRYRQSLVAMNSQGQCYSVIPSTSNTPDNFLSAYVSMELARQVSLAVYAKNMQQAGGKDAFQKLFLRTAAQFPATKLAYLSPEQGWALQQLGIQIPENVRVVTAQEYRRIVEQIAIAQPR